MSAKPTTIEWMHPSWRDLVIDHLASNAAARRKFLSKCGVQGFLLALSSAGGAMGERTIPLLVEQQDWQALNESLPSLLSSENDASGRVLTAVHEAIIASRTSDGNIKQPRLLQLANELLKNLRSCWETTPEQCTVQLLRRYYQLSEFISPLPPGPDLRSVWDLHVETAAEEINHSDPESVKTEYPEVSAWIHLADAIANNEHRFLRQVGFPEKHLKIFKALLSALKSRVTCNFEFETEDNCSDEESRLDDFASLGWLLTKLVPKIADAAKDVAQNAEDKEQAVRDIRHEIEDALKQAGRRPSFPTQTPSTPTAVEHVSIFELFRDL